MRGRKSLGTQQPPPPWCQTQTSRATPSPYLTVPLDRDVLPKPLLPGTPTYHPFVHVRPALALQTGLQPFVDIVRCSLSWLQPLLHLGGGPGVIDHGGLSSPVPHCPLLPQSRNYLSLAPPGDPMANSVGMTQLGGPHWHPLPGLRGQPVRTCPAIRCRPRHVPAAGPHPGTLQSPGCCGGERGSAEWAQVRKPPASSCPPPQSGHLNPCSSQCPSQSGRPGWPAHSIPVGTHSMGVGMGYWAFSSSTQGCVLRQGGRN